MMRAWSYFWWARKNLWEDAPADRSKQTGTSQVGTDTAGSSHFGNDDDDIGMDEYNSDYNEDVEPEYGDFEYEDHGSVFEPPLD